MTIYVDIVLAENLFMNYMILVSTALIVKSEISQKRIVLASLISGIYSILNYIWNVGNFESNIIKFLISILMILIGFNSRKIATIIKQLVIFYLVSFAFGGISFMLLFWVNPSKIAFENGVLVGSYPMKILLLAGLLGSIIMCVVAYVIKDKQRVKSMLCDLEIVYNGRNQIVKTFIDTGNFLKDPITRI